MTFAVRRSIDLVILLPIIANLVTFSFVLISLMNLNFLAKAF